MKRVALVQPGTDEQFSSNEPTNLGCIAAYLLAHGVDVTLVDELAGQDVAKALDAHRPDIVGITATTPLAPDAYRVAALCRERGICTVMGGVHASVLPDEALQHVDVVVKGEGERAMLDIVQNDIRSGIVSRPHVEKLDDVPITARRLMDMDYYLRSRQRTASGYLGFIPPHMNTASVTTTRGCSFSCIYCHNTWRGLPVRSNSPERVIDELEQLVSQYQVEAFFFNEDNAFLKKRRLSKICELMERTGLELIWGGNGRVDDIDLDLLKMVKRAGCRQISFGFESGSQRILDVLNKRTTVEKNQRAIDLCKQAGMGINGTFMIGNPTETMEDIRKTVDFIKRNEIDVLGVVIATPFPGTAMWQFSVEHDLVPDEIDWSRLNLYECAIPACETMSAAEIEKVYRDVVAEVFAVRPADFVSLVRSKLKNPVGTLREVVKDPSKISRLARRLYFGYRKA